MKPLHNVKNQSRDFPRISRLDSLISSNRSATDHPLLNWTGDRLGNKTREFVTGALIVAMIAPGFACSRLASGETALEILSGLLDSLRRQQFARLELVKLQLVAQGETGFHWPYWPIAD